MTMAIAAGPAGPVARDDARSLAGRIEIVGLAEAEPVWRSFEASAVMTPYGRYDWVAAYRSALAGDGRDTRVAILRDGQGEIAFLMAFELHRRLGLTIASAVGGKHANYNLPLLHPDLAQSLRSERAAAILAEAGRALGADMLSIPNMPAAWEGAPNPFAARGLPSAGDAFALRLETDGEETLARSMSADARKKARSKARGIEKLGDIRLERATNAAEVERALDAYWRQKAARLGERGIADPFADAAVRAFFHKAATEGIEDGTPAIEILSLSLDGSVVAVIAGAVDERRFSGMVVSFEAGPLDRYSPGEMLVMGVVRDLCARGYSIFDLGAGDARYKRSICDEIDPLVDLAFPITAKGRAAAAVQAGFGAAKRRLKADPRAMALLGAARRLKARLAR